MQSCPLPCPPRVEDISHRVSVQPHARAQQTVVQAGEPGTWFGIVLTGDLIVELPNFELTVGPGTFIGEMTLWMEGTSRSATMRGKEPGGMIATMLVDEVGGFVEKNPAVGAKLLSLMAGSAIGKQIDNMRRTLRNAATSSNRMELLDHGSGAEAESAAAAFTKMLSGEGFDAAESDAIASAAQYGRFRSEQKLAQPGSSWPSYVAFILSGSLELSPWSLQVDQGGIVGAMDYFGETYFGETCSVKAVGDGRLATLSFAALDTIIFANGAKGPLVEKLLKLMGGFAMLTCSSMTVTDADGADRPLKQLSMVAERESQKAKTKEVRNEG